MNRQGKISASLMCADLMNIEKQVRLLEEARIDYLHIDIMDAHFVPNLTFGPDFVNQLRRITSLPFDVHLLMDRPRLIIRSLDLQPGDIVSIHSECQESILENVAFVKQKGASFGLALNPDTTIEEVQKYLRYVDVVLLMMIVPGFSGSAMINGILDKVADTKAFLKTHRYDNICIEVDGSVSCERAKLLKDLGASIFVGGTSGIFLHNDSITNAVKRFREVIS